MIIGYVSGAWDMFHIGHLNLLKRAKANCDYLIVGVNTDERIIEQKKRKPVFSFQERSAIVEACKYVDKVIPQNDSDRLATWKKYHFNKLFAGSDWKNTPRWNKYSEQLEPLGVKIVFFPRTKGISSTKMRDIIQKISEKEL
ncbi:adenylyltransferase/cytidyltransferase family protein [Candidatus Saccharibacteria bacterium]|nr:adenylyltransferase/cytidyltransferase family protein [Candidatus Saccharibacteria bacterium]